MVVLARFMNGMNAELDKPMSGGLLHIDTDEQQHDLVQRLMMLLQSSVAATPSLDDSAVTDDQALLLLIPAMERRIPHLRPSMQLLNREQLRRGKLKLKQEFVRNISGTSDPACT